MLFRSVLSGPLGDAMEICLNFPTNRSIAALDEVWRAADIGGVGWIAVPDSPMILRDWVAAATYGLTRLDRIGVQIGVTNPVTRHPSITANALMTLAEFGPDRIACAIGAGDSALWTVGLEAAKVDTVRRYTVAVRQLLRGEEAHYRGRRFVPKWLDWEPACLPPVYVAAGGPKMLRMGAQVADGLVVNLGFSTELLAYCNGIIDEACAEVGRNPADLDVWWQSTINFAATVEEAKSRSLGLMTSWITKGSIDDKLIPDEFKEPLIRFNRDMENPARYSTSAEERGRALVERAKQMGLYDWLVTLTPGFFGPSETIADRMAEFADRGMTKWHFYVGNSHIDPITYIHKLTNEVLPRLQRRRCDVRLAASSVESASSTHVTGR